MLFIPSCLTGKRLDEHDGAVVGSEGGAEAAGEAPRQDGAAEQAARPSGKTHVDYGSASLNVYTS